MKGASLTVSLVLHLMFFGWLFYGAFHEEHESVAIHVEFKQGQSASRSQAPSSPAAPQTKSNGDSKLNSKIGGRPSASSGAAFDSATVLGSSLGIDASYPRMSRVLKETGVTILSVHRESSGSATIRVANSSGSARLDQSAVSATQDAFDRGLLNESLSQHQSLRLSFIFRLTP